MIINRCGGSSGAKDAYNCKHMKHMHVCISILRILKHQVVDMSVTVSMVLRILNILLPFSMVLTKKQRENLVHTVYMCLISPKCGPRLSLFSDTSVLYDASLQKQLLEDKLKQTVMVFVKVHN